MKTPLVVLSIPGLRQQDLPEMPALQRLAKTQSRIVHSFPAVTWPSQCTVLTGTTPEQHGVVANGFFWRDTAKVEMWTAWNEVILQPQIWDSLKQRDPQIKTAAWFPMLAKGCGADFVCMPAPIHKPDGSEDMWCYTKPQPFYGSLLESLKHFPLHHFWGPMAGIQSSQWIAQSAIFAAREFKPDFWYIYFPHLDYAAQKDGPDSPAAHHALLELNGVLEQLITEFSATYDQAITWAVVSEYVIDDVNDVTYPNRALREEGLLTLRETDQGREIDFKNSLAWSLVDHQFAHVFIKDRTPSVIEAVVQIFEAEDGYQMVLSGEHRSHVSMNHERSGDVILISSPNSWQAYYWWSDNAEAPAFAKTVDIHRKPGYDPVELFFDMATKTVPLDATFVKGSHGLPAVSAEHQGLFLCSQPDAVDSEAISDTSIHDLLLNLMTE